MWLLVFVSGIFFSGYYCQQMWNKWEISPVLMSLDSNRYPLKNIPFPAVTMCSVNKVSKTKLLRVLEEPRLCFELFNYIAIYNRKNNFAYSRTFSRTSSRTYLLIFKYVYLHFPFFNYMADTKTSPMK